MTEEKKNLWQLLRSGYRGMKKDMEDPDELGSEIALKKRRFRLIVIFGIVMSVVAFLIH